MSYHYLLLSKDLFCDPHDFSVAAARCLSLSAPEIHAQAVQLLHSVAQHKLPRDVFARLLQEIPR
jgi:hypothetical protein